MVKLKKQSKYFDDSYQRIISSRYGKFKDFIQLKVSSLEKIKIFNIEGGEKFYHLQKIRAIIAQPPQPINAWPGSEFFIGNILHF